jgi:hypothetical protein
MTGLDPVRAGLRVRALVGLLHDAARRRLLGDRGEVEYGFLPGREMLREEGIALLTGGAAGEGAKVEASAPAAETMATLPSPPRTDVAPKEAAPPKATPSETAPEGEMPPEPDPFDVWG